MVSEWVQDRRHHCFSPDPLDTQFGSLITRLTQANTENDTKTKEIARLRGEKTILQQEIKQFPDESLEERNLYGHHGRGEIFGGVVYRSVSQWNVPL